MGIMERPAVTVFGDGAKYWEHTYEKFYLKVYVPKSDIDGEALNYTFRAPMLTVLEEKKMRRLLICAFLVHLEARV